MLKKFVKFLLAIALLSLGMAYFYKILSKKKVRARIRRNLGKRSNRGWKNRCYQGPQRKYNRRGLVRINR